MDRDTRKPVSISMLISTIQKIHATKDPKESRSAFVERAVLLYLKDGLAER